MRVTDSTAPRAAAALTIDWDAAAAGQDGYDDFMTKEIHEQPKAVAATLRGRRAPDGTLVLDESAGLSHDDLRSIERVCIVACGSSYHAGLVAKYAIEQWRASRPTSTSRANSATATRS